MQTRPFFLVTKAMFANQSPSFSYHFFTSLSIFLLHEEWMKASLRLLDELSIWLDIKPVNGD